MNDYIARFRVNDFEKQELKEHIREVQKLAAAMGKRVDLRRTVSSKELYSDKKVTLESTLCSISRRRTGVNEADRRCDGIYEYGGKKGSVRKSKKIFFKY